MSPSKIVRRTGIVTSIAGGAFAIALAASPAQAAGSTLLPGMPCPLTLDPSTGLQCVNGILEPISSQLPLPAPAPTSSAPAAGPTSAAPNPLSGAVGSVGGLTGTLGQTLGNTTNTVGGAVGQTLGGAPGVPTAPGTPGSLPGAPGSTGGSGSTGGTTTSGSGSTTNAKNAKGAVDGSGLLGPAAAFLPGSAVAGFADLGSTGISDLAPLADNIPAPLLASPEARLAAVQAPLIAAGEKANKDSGSFLARFADGKALPGLLVVIGTAMVAAVGAGNIRAWQAKLAAGGLKAPAWLRLPPGLRMPTGAGPVSWSLRVPWRRHRNVG